MPNLHDIERRISSVSSTRQITRTMEMVSAAKIRRATERMERSIPWTRTVSDMLMTTAPHTPVEAEPLLHVHDELKTTLFVVIASDRGLAGGFNSSILRHADKMIAERQAKGINIEVAACGKKAISFFSYRGLKPVLEFAGHSADPKYMIAQELMYYIYDNYTANNIDEVIIIHNHAKNAAEQKLIERQILPVTEDSYAELLGIVKKEVDIYLQFRKNPDQKIPGDVDFVPDSEGVMTWLMREYIRDSCFYALLDSAAGEQGARRNAMKSATDNANEMISTLTRIYNRARQGAITTEINEIVGGAAALEE